MQKAVAALTTSPAPIAVLVASAVTFISLTLGSHGVGNSVMVEAGGWLALLTALLAFYASAPGVINETHSKVVLPVCPRSQRTYSWRTGAQTLRDH